MTEDAELLRRYAEEGDDHAFAELVRRHVNLVYSAALRQLNGDAHLATDATQRVFADLARKAGALREHRVLGGWLYTSTRFVTAKLVRGERRRQAREREAQLMEDIMRSDAAVPDWDRIRPVLDDALGELGAADREAIVLRFFEGRDYRTVGLRLALSENAARMRVERALEKLRGCLARHGVDSPAAALALALAGPAVAAAPAGLAAAVTGPALASGAAAAGGGWAAWVNFMSSAKLHVSLSGALLVAGAAGLVVQTQSNADLRAEVAGLRAAGDELSGLERDNRRLAQLLTETAELRSDDAAFVRLQQEATQLRGRWDVVVRQTEEKSRAARAAAALAATQIFQLGELDQTPVARFQARPHYPTELRTSGIEGSVVVEFIVNVDGDVQQARAIRSTRNELESAAAEAVAKWKFKPGRKDGRDVNTRMQVPIVFTIADKSRPTPPASGNAVERAPENSPSQPFTVQYTGSGTPGAPAGAP